MMVLCGKLEDGHKGWIERVICFFKKRIQNASNKEALVYDVSYYFERKWAFTQQPARCNSESNLANIGRACSGVVGHGESGRVQHSQDDLQVTLCDEYQDPVDLIAELKNSRTHTGSDGCLEDMYSTPYASMNLVSSGKLAAAAANVRNGADDLMGVGAPPRPPHVRRANSTSASHGGGNGGRKTDLPPGIPRAQRKAPSSSSHQQGIPLSSANPLRQQQQSSTNAVLPPQQFQGSSSTTTAAPPVPAPRHPRQGTTYQNLPPVDNSNKTPPRTSSRQPFPLPTCDVKDINNKVQQNPSCDNRPEEDYDSPWDIPKGGQPSALQRSGKVCTSSVSSISSASSAVSGLSGPVGVSSCNPSGGDSSPNMAPRVPAHRSASSVSSGSADLHRTGSSDSSSVASRPSLPLNLNGSPKRSRGNMAFNFGCSVPLPQGEPVDPALGLARQGWYHGAISRVDAECLLRSQKEGSYLVRISESSKQDYSLSIKSTRGFMHMKIVYKSDGRFVLGQFSKPFESIPEMIHHYSLNKLPIKGAEHMSLLHPVIAQLL
ncbi:uncharacterized protein LOC111263386 isoform X2 [Varroa jacobsoni]|uniref:uncharacterized protein LOC111263386 isoform X2 n=1 Tax=Varroa jacobsoni TaxID=62625 RepID=UPI000BF750E5|nr:uncharacterized protein LOC111263386 isoform X2 [Varroa jacobsoni]